MMAIREEALESGNDESTCVVLGVVCRRTDDLQATPSLSSSKQQTTRTTGIQYRLVDRICAARMYCCE